MNHLWFPYILIGCWIIGSAQASYEKRCPYDREPTPEETAAAIVFWPYKLMISFHRDHPPNCLAVGGSQL
jgi:hypothetical protein